MRTTSEPTRIAISPEFLGAVRPFALIGSLGIVLGGFVAAITGPTNAEHGSWTAAYLVLVVGVAQIALGFGQAFLAGRLPTRSTTNAQVIAFNLGNAAVIIGTLVDRPWVVDLGGVLLASALVYFLRATRFTRGGWLPMAYRLLVLVVLVSIPIGLMLGHLRA